RRGLDTLGRWIGAGFSAEGLVITHGEPHPGNIIRVAPNADADGLAAADDAAAGATGGAGPASGAIMLIDWDTVGLAPPERDLWMAAHQTRAGRPRATGGGRPPRPVRNCDATPSSPAGPSTWPR